MSDAFSPLALAIDPSITAAAVSGVESRVTAVVIERVDASFAVVVYDVDASEYMPSIPGFAAKIDAMAFALAAVASE